MTTKMESKDGVELNLTISVYQHSVRDAWAVRCPELGLTGYGKTEEEAEQSLDRLVKKFASTYSKLGQLTQRLKQAGVMTDSKIDDSWHTIRHGRQLMHV
jgi:hypothetical protein